jgi:hypothetical protein
MLVWADDGSRRWVSRGLVKPAEVRPPHGVPDPDYVA